MGASGSRFGCFLKPNLKSYVKNKVNKKHIDTDTSEIYAESLKSYYPTVEDTLLESEVKQVYIEFKKSLGDKRDKKMLKVLEKYNGVIYDKEIFPKLGFESQPAFWYQKEKLKKQYIQFMHKKGYDIQY